ncbi:hypothetical protein ELQ87_24170 [Streptomyces griseoviridis]|uniref:Uncharacterized protein n=1 Tax=Streptomyces griseoviridis TaxID=45398 RepID=A0A3S9ZGY9_STRGD|nr:hypothetical protein ELQ87_24170 [Streptomyces griseoviridis]QCN86143.1 hypothetical protein DDJ31_15100 [Streptomyces griseoviridis]
MACHAVTSSPAVLPQPSALNSSPPRAASAPVTSNVFGPSLRTSTGTTTPWAAALCTMSPLKLSATCKAP